MSTSTIRRLIAEGFPRRTNTAKALPGSFADPISSETAYIAKPMHGGRAARRLTTASKIYSIYQ